MTFPEPLAERILRQAITEHRCAEMLQCLFDGGSVTVDAATGRLALADAGLLREFAGEAIGFDGFTAEYRALCEKYGLVITFDDGYIAMEVSNLPDGWEWWAFTDLSQSRLSATPYWPE